MNEQLRDDIRTARAMYIDMVARCNDMLARCDGLDGSEVAEIRAEVIEMAGKLETLNYWLGCLEWRGAFLARSSSAALHDGGKGLH
jgi:hypothetical protein